MQIGVDWGVEVGITLASTVVPLLLISMQWKAGNTLPNCFFQHYPIPQTRTGTAGGGENWSETQSGYFVHPRVKLVMGNPGHGHCSLLATGWAGRQSPGWGTLLQMNSAVVQAQSW